MVHMLQVFLFAFVGAIIFTWLAIRLSAKFGIMDFPDAERKVHTRPVPLLGGVAVFAAYTLALLLNFHFSWELKGVVIASFFLMISGLLDDVKGLSAAARLLIQVLCALVVVSFGVCLKIIPDNWPFSYTLEVIITVIWIVGITNALNFMDGIDGLAAGITLIASSAFFVIAYQTGQGYFAFLNIALAGASLGFLVFNFYPAKIFLGDAGSSFLGFSLASLAVMGDWAEKKPIVAFSIPLLVLAVLIFDMVYISASRIYHGKVKTFKEWIEYTGKDHLHHRLLRIGFSQVQAVLFIYLISIVFAFAALALRYATMAQAVLLLLQGIFILIIVTVLMMVGHEHMQEKRSLEKRLKEAEGE